MKSEVVSSIDRDPQVINASHQVDNFHIRIGKGDTPKEDELIGYFEAKEVLDKERLVHADRDLGEGSDPRSDRVGRVKEEILVDQLLQQRNNSMGRKAYCEDRSQRAEESAEQLVDTTLRRDNVFARQASSWADLAEECEPPLATIVPDTQRHIAANQNTESETFEGEGFIRRIEIGDLSLTPDDLIAFAADRLPVARAEYERLQGKKGIFSDAEFKRRSLELLNEVHILAQMSDPDFITTDECVEYCNRELERLDQRIETAERQLEFNSPNLARYLDTTYIDTYNLDPDLVYNTSPGVSQLLQLGRQKMAWVHLRSQIDPITPQSNSNFLIPVREE